MTRKTIAVVGASSDRRKFGNKCVRAYLGIGYEVFPVNLRAREIEGLTVYRSIEDVPSQLDRISVYLQPETTGELVPALAKRPGTQVWFNPGSADSRVLAKADEANIDYRTGCSIMDIGLSPAHFPPV